MKEIKLTQGKVAIIDDDDYGKVQGYTWRAQKDHNTFYALGYKPGKTPYRTISMHRLLMGIIDNPNILIDHRDNDGLNNRKLNLRFCNSSQNGQNRLSKKNGTSKYLGVSIAVVKYKRVSKKLNVLIEKTYTYWQANININGKDKKIGNFKDEIEAAKAYDKIAIENFGEFAKPNFKIDDKNG